MDFITEMFKRVKIVPLQKRGNVEYEVEYQKKLITDQEFEILKTIKDEDKSYILFRHYYGDTPREEEETIVLCLRIITSKGILYPEPTLRAFFHDHFSEIELADIDIKVSLSNYGYGSILLGTLISIAKERGSKNITGWLSSVDMDHIDRIIHFYTKHGFEVEMTNQNNRVGNIIWTNPLK